MSEDVKCKIVSWTLAPAEWFPKLACGHDPYEYDSGVRDEQKAVLEAEGEMYCSACTRKARRIRDLERDLREAKAEAKRRRESEHKGPAGE